MSSFRKAHKAQRKTHRERSQPAKRKRFGLLEKGQDWKQRRENFHFKEKRMKALHEKARNRNPDEFYFAMVNQKTKGGVHDHTRDGITYSKEEIKLLKTQDLSYITIRQTQEREKINKLKQELNFASEPIPNEDSDDDTAGLAPVDRGKHKIFVGSSNQVEDFDAAAHFETAPELMNRPMNRPRISTLETQSIQGSLDSRSVKRLDKQRLKAYKELEQRHDRLDQLNRIACALQTQRNLQGKGKCKKVRDATESAPAVYKWRKERKK